MWNNTCCSCSIYIQLFCAWRCPSQSASSGIDIPKFSRRFTQQPSFSGSFNLTKSSAPSKEGEHFFSGIERGMGSRCSCHQNQSEFQYGNVLCLSLRKFQVICHQCHNIVLDFLWMSKHLHNNHFFQLFLSIDRMIFQRQVPTLEKYGGQDLALLEISLFWWIHLKVPQWHLNHKIHI